LTAVFLRAWKDLEAREKHRRELRRFRIENWYRDVYKHECSGDVDPASLFRMSCVVLVDVIHEVVARVRESGLLREDACEEMRA
jgi:hypothetical protein